MAAHRLPLAVDLAGRRVLVVGGGAVARRKVASLLDAEAEVVVVAPELCPELAGEPRITWLGRSYEPQDLEGAWLAVAATDSPAVNRAVADEAHRRRIWCNVAAPPEAGDCHVLATVRQAGITVALGTEGASPFAARKLRERIEQVVSPALGELVQMMGELRGEVQERLATEGERRACYESMWSSAAVERLAAGDTDDARALLRAILDEAAQQ